MWLVCARAYMRSDKGHCGSGMEKPPRIRSFLVPYEAGNGGVDVWYGGPNPSSVYGNQLVCFT